jgi:2-polyprenyl-3-methyl-5-hydroxy-6-metoxy-1,4-benzoquinol methylase
MVALDDLISPGYLKMQRLLHDAPRGYGGRGDKWAGIVLQIAMAYHARSILDYGSGEGSLAKALRASPYLGDIQIAEYDPAMPGVDQLPAPADFVNVTDVLEHIEKDRLAAVLEHIRSLAHKVVFAVISTKKTNKVLADGRNAHLIIKPDAWWKQRLRQAGFDVHPPPSVVRQIPEREWSVILTRH